MNKSCKYIGAKEIKRTTIQLYQNKIHKHRLLISLLTSRARRSILPLEGHEDGGLLSSTMAGGSAGISMNCIILSTEMIWFDDMLNIRLQNTWASFSVNA